MSKAKVVAGCGFKGGVGKSSLIRVLPLIIKKELNKNSIMFSFDVKRDASQYSSDEIAQMNIEMDGMVTKNENDEIIVQQYEKITSENGDTNKVLKNRRVPTDNIDYIFMDFGGQYDKRIYQANADYYIVPTVGDKESISESIRTAEFIRMNLPKTSIIFVYNPFNLREKKDREEFRLVLIDALKKTGFSDCAVVDLPYSKMFANLTTEKVKLSTILMNPLRAGYYYKYFLPKIRDIIDIIK